MISSSSGSTITFFRGLVALSVFFSAQLLGTPIFTKTDIDLGTQLEDQAFEFDLKSVTEEPQGGTILYEAFGLPTWMTLKGSVLSGTPKRVDVKEYDGIVLRAKSQFGIANAKAKGKVQKVLHPPKWISKEFSVDDASEDKSYTKDLRTFVMNPEQANLSFEIISQSPTTWLKVSQFTGELWGTPTKPNLGKTKVVVRFSTTLEGTSYEDLATITLNVNPVNHPPVWISPIITLPSGRAQLPYKQELGKSVSDKDDGDTVTFKLDSFAGPGQSWLAINATTGTIEGTPQKANIGRTSYMVTATDKSGSSSATKVWVDIIKSNEPPFWKQQGIAITDAFEGKAYAFDLSSYVEDPDGDKIQFQLLTGPKWLSVSAGGVLLGQPSDVDIGPQTITVRASDNFAGGSIATFKFMVNPVNHPPEWYFNPVTVYAWEDKQMRYDLNDWVTDKDFGDAVTYVITEGPGWAEIVGHEIAGTSPMGLLDDVKFRIRATDKLGAYSDGQIIVHILHTNHKPSWTQNPIKLGPVPEGVEFKADLKPFANDPDPKDKLTFAKKSGPSWLVVNADGTISGIPQRRNGGPNSFEVQVTDDSSEFDVATLQIEVKSGNVAPKWKDPKLSLPPATIGVLYEFNVRPLALDEDGDPLKFTKLTGPDWITVTPEGLIQANAPAAGEFNLSVRVADPSGSAADIEGSLKVQGKNQPPVISSDLPVVKLKEREVTQFDLAKYVSDAEGDKLTFALDGTYDWITMLPTGKVTFSPKFKEIKDSPYSIKFKVDDTKTAVNGTLKVEVARVPRPPVWLEAPIQATGETGKAFELSVADKAQDLDGLPIKFQKKEGQTIDWLNVSDAGKVSGTPPAKGSYSLIINACNDKLCDGVTLTLDVAGNSIVEKFPIPKKSASDNTEFLWVLDNSAQSRPLVKSLQDNLPILKDAYQKEGVTFSSVFLSTDSKKFGGFPSYMSDTPVVISSWSADWLKNTLALIQRTEGDIDNRLNSPVMSFHLFLKRIEELKLYFGTVFYQTEKPIEVTLVTNQLDHYPELKKTNPTPFSSGKTILDTYREVLRPAKKPIVINAIVNVCPELVTQSESTAHAPQELYKELVESTGGNYFEQKCSNDTEVAVKTLTIETMKRTALLSKRKYALSVEPKSPQTMQLKIGGQVIPGNKSADDAWYYSKEKNSIYLDWTKIDRKPFKSLEEIAVEYDGE